MLNKELRNNGFNLRERANIYAGAALGFAAPIVAFKYLAFSGMDHQSDLKSELFEWGAAVAVPAVTSVLLRGFPLFYSTMAGLVAGGLCAHSLKDAREKKEGLASRLLELPQETTQ